MPRVEPLLRHMTPRLVPIPVPPFSATRPRVAHFVLVLVLVRVLVLVLVLVLVRRNAKALQSAGQRVGKLEVLGRAKKQ